MYFIHVYTLNWVRSGLRAIFPFFGKIEGDWVVANLKFLWWKGGGGQTPYIIPCHSTWQFCDRSIISSFHIKQLPNYSENILKMYIFSFSIVHCTFGFSELSLLVDDISFTVHFVYLHYNEIFAEFCRIMINRNGHLYNVIQL